MVEERKQRNEMRAEVLKNAGIVVTREEGTTVYYSLTCNCIGDIIESVETVLRNALDKRTAAMKIRQ